MTYSLECDLQRKTTNRAVQPEFGSQSRGCRPTYLPAEGREVQRILLQKEEGPMGFIGITVGNSDTLGYEM